MLELTLTQDEAYTDSSFFFDWDSADKLLAWYGVPSSCYIIKGFLQIRLAKPNLMYEIETHEYGSLDEGKFLCNSSWQIRYASKCFS